MTTPFQEAYHFEFEVEPSADSPHAQRYGGAFAHCFLASVLPRDGRSIAEDKLAEMGWEVVAERRFPSLVSRQTFAGNADKLAILETALRHGESYALLTWPIDTAVH